MDRVDDREENEEGEAGDIFDQTARQGGGCESNTYRIKKGKNPQGKT